MNRFLGRLVFIFILVLMSSISCYTVKAEVVKDYYEDFNIVKQKLNSLDTSFAFIEDYGIEASDRFEAAYKMLGLTNKDAPINFNGAWCARFQSVVCSSASIADYPNSNLVTDWVNYLRDKGAIYKVSSAKSSMPQGTIYLEEELDELDYDFIKPGDYIFHKQNSNLGNSHILLCVYKADDFIVTIDGNGGSFTYGDEAEKQEAHNYLTSLIGISETYEDLTNRLRYTSYNKNTNKVYYKVLRKTYDNEGRLILGRNYVSHVGRILSE